MNGSNIWKVQVAVHEDRNLIATYVCIACLVGWKKVTEVQACDFNFQRTEGLIDVFNKETCLAMDGITNDLSCRADIEHGEKLIKDW